MSPTFRFTLQLASLVLLLLAGNAPGAVLRLLPWDDAVAARQLGLADGKETTTLTDLHPNKRSAAHRMPGDGSPMRLVMLDRKDAEGRPLTLDIKPGLGVKQPLVLILPDATAACGLRLFVVDDDPAGFPWGGIRFLNATGKDLLTRHEKTVKKLTAGWTPVDIVPGGSARRAGVLVAAADAPESVLYSAVWEHDPDSRKLVFIVPGKDARTGALELRILPEHRASITPEPAVDGASE